MKFMNLKRFASTALAGVMAISLTIPAFAAANTTTISGTYEETTLAVTVPTTGTVAINPYGLPFSMGEGNTVSGQQIATKAPLVVANKSAVALKVSANVKAVEAGALKIVAENAVAAATVPSVYVEFQMFEAPGVAGDAVTDAETLNPKFAALKDGDAKCHTAVTTTAADEPDILTLRAGDADGNVQDGGAAFFRLSGKAVKKPTTAWTTNDKFTATVVFTFEPGTYSKPAGTIAGAGDADAAAADGGTLSLTLTPELPSNVTVTKWEWSSSNTAEATVVALTDTTKATVTDVTGGTAGTVTITATGTGSDGLTYTSTFEFTTKNA